MTTNIITEQKSYGSGSPVDILTKVVEFSSIRLRKLLNHSEFYLVFYFHFEHKMAPNSAVSHEFGLIFIKLPGSHL